MMDETKDFPNNKCHYCDNTTIGPDNAWSLDGMKSIYVCQEHFIDHVDKYRRAKYEGKNVFDQLMAKEAAQKPYANHWYQDDQG